MRSYWGLAPYKAWNQYISASNGGGKKFSHQRSRIRSFLVTSSLKPFLSIRHKVTIRFHWGRCRTRLCLSPRRSRGRLGSSPGDCWCYAWVQKSPSCFGSKPSGWRNKRWLKSWELVGFDAGVKILIKLPVHNFWVFHAEAGFFFKEG